MNLPSSNKKPITAFTTRSGYALILTLGLHVLLSVTPLTEVYAQGSSNRPSVPSSNQLGWQKIWQDAQNERLKKHDPNYEKGKAIFNGQANYPNYRYCVPKKPLGAYEAVEPEHLVELNRKSLKPFRRLRVGDFANQLYDCDEPSIRLLGKLPKEDAGLVIYFLDREYKLKLKQSRNKASKKSK